MEIEIRNFGPIECLKFDLEKDLHLIYGQNAIGKSYATYCLYCLIKNIKNKTITYRQIYHYDKKGNNPFDKFMRTALKNIKSTKTALNTDDFKSLIEDELKQVFLESLQNSLLNTFSSLQNLKNRYNNKNYEIILKLSEKEKIIIFSNNKGELDLKYDVNIKTFEIVQKTTKSTKYSFYLNSKIGYGKPNEEEFISEFVKTSYGVINAILKKLDNNIRDVYYLPASRSGLYQALSAFTPIIAELTQSRFFMSNKSIELPSLSEPLADYFIDLSTLDKTHINKEFDGIIKLMQKEILRGEVEYNDETKRILYRPNGIKLELNLSEASSMVSELSPLVLYFKHILNNKYSSKKNRDFYYEDYYDFGRKKDKGYDVIFIEEPEAHLHPEVQIKLLEIFAKLAKLKLKIVITSHSNYMFNKLNNLLIKNEVDDKTVMVYHLGMTEQGTKDKHDMIVTEEGINDENFQDVTEELYYERLNYLEKNDNTAKRT
jgi:predicted ATP-dependent endonuclease of OLD family